MAKTNSLSNGGKGDQETPSMRRTQSHKTTISSFAAEESDHEETSAEHTRRDRLQKNWFVIFKDVKVVQVRHD